MVLIFGHLKRQGERHGKGDIPVPLTFLLIATALSAMTLAITALVFLTFPRVSQGWAGGGGVLATSIAGFADAVTLGGHGGQIYGNPQIVLRWSSPGGFPPTLSFSTGGDVPMTDSTANGGAGRPGFHRLWHLRPGTSGGERR